MEANVAPDQAVAASCGGRVLRILLVWGVRFTGECLAKVLERDPSVSVVGLYANLSRFVHFEPPDAELAARLEACQRILARLRAATRPGRTLGDVFDDCRNLYAEAGAPDGWRHHHQGGLTGYRSREVIAAPGVAVEIAAGQAFAWNPSLPGAKAEETFLLTADGPEVLCA